METNTKKKIGLLGCIGTGIGAIIGSGIFGSLPTVINDIGTGIVLALLATIVYTLAKTIPNVYLSSVTPASGSFFIAPTKLIHPAVGVFMAAQNLLQPVLISVFAVLFGDYFVALFPALSDAETLVEYDPCDTRGSGSLRASRTVSRNSASPSRTSVSPTLVPSRVTTNSARP